MRILVPVLLLLLSGASAPQPVPPGRWNVTSTVVDITAAGAPGFLLRMARGRSKTEPKCLSAEQARAGIAAVLAPDPKAQCHLDSLRVDGGRYAQALTCPQKKGEPVRVTRSGSYDATGFAGRAEMIGRTPKGPLDIVLQQRAVHVAGTCTG